jgi:ABC-type uncharacterized transport system permease subunit
MKSSILEGVFETLIVLPTKYKAHFWMAGMLRFPRELLRLCIQLLVAVIVFNMKIPITFFSNTLPLIFLGIPAFLGIGYAFLAFFILTGRGNAISGLVNAVFAFAAGAYFPLSLFPSWVQQIGERISPFTLILEKGRLAVANEDIVNVYGVLLNLAILNILYAGVGFLLIKYALKKWRKNGNSWTTVI